MRRINDGQVNSHCNVNRSEIVLTLLISADGITVDTQTHDSTR